MVASLISKIEQNIRNLTLLKGIRTSEFFYDFDKLRSGFVTASQFIRVLNKNFELKFKPEEEEALLEKYKCNENEKINYKLFCETIDKTFDPKNFSDKSCCQTINQGYSKPENELWSPNLDGPLRSTLKRLYEFYSFRQLSLRNLCKDFDEHNKGIINKTQFYRSLVLPTDFTEEEIILLVQKYEDPSFPGMVRYMDLVEDMKQFDECKKPRPDDQINIACCVTKTCNSKDLHSLLTRLCELAYSSRIRAIDFFKDYDALKTGTITVTQFLAGLDLCLGKVTRLTDEDKSRLVQEYRIPDGRVCYKNFCSLLDDAFLEINLERKPTKDVQVPVPEMFGRKVNVLPQEEEDKLNTLLFHIRKEMKFSRCPLDHFFKNFHQGLNTRVVTKSQFHRVLSQCSINVHPEEFILLCKKFAFTDSDLINYPAFVELVDSGKLHQQMKLRAAICQPKKQKQEMCCDEEVDVNSIIAQLKHHLIVKRIRPKDFFEDFDPLKTGRMSKSQFKRSLISMGCGSLHLGINLSESQIDALANAYSCSTGNGGNDTLWVKFVEDLETGYLEKNLEKKPCLRLTPISAFICSKPNTLDVDMSSEEHKERFKKTMCKTAFKIREQNIDLLQIFRNFDKLRHGHLNRIKFRQALGVANLMIQDELDMTAIEAAFYNNDGVNYIAFLDYIAKEDPRQDVNEMNKKIYQERMDQKLLNCCDNDDSISSDLQELLLKVKTKLAKENIRVIDWFKDYDKLNTGYVSKINFRRALDLCRFGIKEPEIYLLEDFLKAPSDPNKMNYRMFSDELESIFACQNLEKTPTKDVELFKVPEKLSLNTMNEKDEAFLNCCLEKLLTKYKVLRPSFFPFFKDFDKVNIGSVSKSQFRRALGELNLASEMSSEAAWNLLYKKFAVQIGGREDVDYLSFFNWVEKNSRRLVEC